MIDDKVKSYNHYRFEKKYTLSLVYGIISMVLSTIFAISYIAIGANVAAFVQFIGSFIFMIVVGLLRRRIQWLTRYVAIITALTLVGFQTVFVFGSQFGFHYQFFPLVVVVFLLMDLNIFHEKIMAYLLSITMVILFFVCENIYQPIVLESFAIYKEYYFIFTIVASFLSLILIFHYISVEIFSTKDQLFQMATRDALTGLYNRRTFIQQGTTFFKIAQRGGNPFTILIFDIDDFKSVNDLHGHIAGDHYLQGLSNLCKNTLRDSDFIARYGGEEFGVLLSNTNEDEGYVVAEKLRESIENFYINEGSIVIKRTVSIGLEGYSHDYENFHELLDKGDKAMYASKNKGKNTVTIY
jgi:diguanylate cyclase (GGDEF)-like protein